LCALKQGAFAVGNQWEERRRGRRYACPTRVAIGSRWAVGHDISRGGISVLMREALPVGNETTVTLGRASSLTGEMRGRARVLRSDPHPRGYRVALQFID
jgi:hypothetical protein